MTTIPARSLRWGQVTLHLADPLFAQGYADGRTHYVVSCVEAPRRARSLAATDVLRLIATPDEKGQYHCEADEFLPLDARLGFVAGYLSGPINDDPVAAAARERYRLCRERDLAPDSLSAPSVAWGCVMLSLDHDAFAEGYADGRECYVESCMDHPDHTRVLTDDEMVRTIAFPDGEHYRLDVEEMNFSHSLGFFVGYLAGPLSAETPEEHARRVAEVQV